MNEPPAERDIFNETAVWVPAPYLTTYWRIVAHIRKLPADDEITLILQGMGIYTFLTRQLPTELLKERGEWKKCFDAILAENSRLVNAAKTHAVSAENALAVSAKKMEDSSLLLERSAAMVQKGLLEAGNHVDAQKISQEVANQLEVRLIEPVQKAVEEAAEMAQKLPKLIEKSEKSIRFLEQLNVGWHWGNALISSAVIIVISVFLIWSGLRTHYQDAIKDEIARINRDTELNDKTVKQLNLLGKHIELITVGSKWQLLLPQSEEAFISTTQCGVINFKAGN